jgi:hypothetical protein
MDAGQIGVNHILYRNGALCATYGWEQNLFDDAPAKMTDHTWVSPLCGGAGYFQVKSDHILLFDYAVYNYLSGVDTPSVFWSWP